MSGSAADSSINRSWRMAFLVAGGFSVVAIGAVLAIYGGVYNVAADVPHSQPVYRLLETMRDRSIASRAAGITIPSDLNNPERIGSGAGQYAEMCSGCHLAPGMSRTEMSRGLYPRAPELRRGSRPSPAEDFWVVKHGIKMTGMPAWGVTHNDKLLWDIVAFLQKLPQLSPSEYQAIVKSSPKTHDEMMEEMEGGNGNG